MSILPFKEFRKGFTALVFKPLYNKLRKRIFFVENLFPLNHSTYYKLLFVITKNLQNVLTQTSPCLTLKKLNPCLLLINGQGCQLDDLKTNISKNKV